MKLIELSALYSICSYYASTSSWNQFFGIASLYTKTMGTKTHFPMEHVKHANRRKLELDSRSSRSAVMVISLKVLKGLKFLLI